MKTIFDPNPGCGVGRPIGGGRIVTELPGLPAALDAIDLQLAAGSDGVVLPRDAAALVACALHGLPDLLAAGDATPTGGES